MPVKSTAERYGAVAIAMHWISALAIAAALVAGLQTGAAVDPASKLVLLRIHVTLGILAVVLTALRMAWWVVADRRPAGVPGLPRWQSLAARVVQLGFYVAILALGTSGIALLVISGAAPVVLLGVSGTVPDFFQFVPRTPHGILSRVLLALMAAHIGAALYHQLIRRDRLLARMGLGG